MAEETARRFTDRTGYLAAVDDLLAHFAHTLDIFDTDLRDSGLSQAQRVEQLSGLLARYPHAAVRIVLHDAGPLQHHMPRLWNLCIAQSHRVQIRQTPRNLQHLSETFMLAGPGSALIRTHAAHWRGKLLHDDRITQAGYAGRFDDLWTACSCCVSATKLGL